MLEQFFSCSITKNKECNNPNSFNCAKCIHARGAAIEELKQMDSYKGGKIITIFESRDGMVFLATMTDPNMGELADDSIITIFTRVRKGNLSTNTANPTKLRFLLDSSCT